MKKNLHGFVLVALLIAFGVLSYRAVENKSPTWDEPVHMAAAYLLRVDAGRDINPEHPPLMKRLASLAFVLSGQNPVRPLTQYHGWIQGNPYAFARELLYSGQIDVDRLFSVAHILCIVVGLLLCLTIYGYSRLLWGDDAALLSLVLAALCPNLLAYAPLVHTDVAAALGFIATSLAFYIYSREPTPKKMAFAAATLGVALGLKFSCVLLLPYALATFFWTQGQNLRRSPRTALVHLMILGLVPLLLLVFFYGSPSGPLRYWQGLNTVYANHSPDYAVYLAGKFRKEGFLSYYWLALAVKLPDLTLAIILVGFGAVLRSSRQISFHLLVPPGLILLAGMFNRHNMGLRHVLPCLPFFFVWAGSLSRLLSPRVLRAVGAGCAAFLTFELTVRYPHYLAYFNEISGGPKAGLRWLDESNIDWGQDLKALPAALRDLGIGRIGLLYFGNDDPTYRGLDFYQMKPRDIYLPDGDYVVSAHFLRRNRLWRGLEGCAFDWLERFRPARIVGHSLYIYRIRPGEKNDFVDGTNFLDRQEWLREGTARLQQLSERSTHAPLP